MRMRQRGLLFGKVLPLLVLLAVTNVAAGQTSVVRQYSTLAGDSVLTRTDNSVFVTCCNTASRHSCFVVDNGTTRRKFFTTPEPSGIYATDSGYVVKDMQLVNGVCWFAGYKWVNTGQPMYTLDGQAYILITYAAFVGRFNTADALGSGGSYNIALIPQLHHIERLAVIGSNVTAIGVKETGGRRLVEIFHLLSADYLRIEASSNAEEEFMDVVAGNKVVVLSRFKNASHYMWYKYYFGLRYGSAGNMYGTGNNIQIYNVMNTAQGWQAAFPSVHPMRLAATNNGNGVVAAYIAQDNQYSNPLLGKFVLFHIPTEGAASTDVIVNQDSYQYTELADIRFNKPVTNNTYMALLLRDGTSNSILRFPHLSFPQTLSEDVYYMANPQIKSVAPYQTGTVGLELSAAGYYTGSTHYLAGITQRGVYDYTSSTCFIKDNGYISISNANSKEMVRNDALIDDGSIVSGNNNGEGIVPIEFSNHSYSTSSVLRVSTCNSD